MEFERETPKSERIPSEIKLYSEREKVRDVDEPMEKMVIFRVAGELYAFPGRNVMEILPAMEISPIPGMPPCIPGLITVRRLIIEAPEDIISSGPIQETSEISRNLTAMAAQLSGMMKKFTCPEEGMASHSVYEADQTAGVV